MMKKGLMVLTSLLLVMVLFAACGSEEAAPAEETTVENTDTATETSSDEEAVDAVTTASIVDNAEALVSALGEEGTWIVAALNDLSYDDEIVVAGEFIHREAVDRKLALYTQDEDHNITAQFTLTAPKLVVKSENFRIQGGTFKGDVYVEANGFKVDKAGTVDGNIYFASKEYMDSFTVTDSSSVTGTVQVDGVDVVTSASIVNDAAALVNGLSAEGTWIVAALNNVTLTEELVVDGEFIHREEIARKLALYTQDEERNITASFVLTAPKLVVKSENFRIQGGTFKGDVYVEAPGFNLVKGTVDGNVYFADEALKDSMVMDEDSVVTGEIAVQ